MSNKHAIPLYVQCNPLLDIVVDVDDDFLLEHRLEKNCAYLYGPEHRNLFETMLTHRTLSVAPGGSGLTAARVAQWVWQNVLRKPGHVMYVGCVGKDRYGDQLRETAEADGVTMELEVSGDMRSGLCAVCKDGDARTLVAHPSSANCLSDDFVNSASAQDGQGAAAILYTSAYATVSRVQQTLRLVTSSRSRTLPTGAKQLSAMGLSNKRVMNEFGEDLVDVLAKLDIIIGNQDEMNDLAMMLQWVPSEMTDAELVKKIATEMMYDRHAVRRVIMTRGAMPILYATSDGDVGEVPVVPVEAGSAKVATTGAGDAFAGAALAGMAARPSDVAYCCRLGARAAAFAINHGIRSLPTDDESLAELQE
ncbi:adenosine kinase-like protein [Novymonas esmeraldas]|uniref:Adenosine kinase n=1 Tax=Novymonas esmeraldas TaxID=1808958 RepID=A0AAW0ELE1_9TRYP